jgi:hypothetical protein
MFIPLPRPATLGPTSPLHYCLPFHFLSLAQPDPLNNQTDAYGVFLPRPLCDLASFIYIRHCAF